MSRGGSPNADRDVDRGCDRRDSPHAVLGGASRRWSAASATRRLRPKRPTASPSTRASTTCSWSDRDGASPRLDGLNSLTDTHVKPLAAGLARSTGRRVVPRVADVTRPATVERAVAQMLRDFGKLGILVDNLEALPAAPRVQRAYRGA